MYSTPSQDITYNPQVPYSVPQQFNATNCGLYVIAFANHICHGGDPGTDGFTLHMKDIQSLRFNIIVRFAKEWVLQQAHALNLLKNDPINAPMTCSSISEPSAPFPLVVRESPLGSVSAVAESYSMSREETIDPSLLYTPPIGAWGLWPLPDSKLYYPAQVICWASDVHLAMLEWLDGGVVLGDTSRTSTGGQLPTFQQTSTECFEILVEYDSLDPLQPHQVRITLPAL
jgi:hypothetical protein